MATAYQSFHNWLFNRQGIGVSGEQVALMAPVPSRSAYPDAAAQEYAAISLDVLSRYFREPRLRGRNDDALVSASLRLLILEPIFAERIEDVPELLNSIVQDGDVIVTQGAGNVSRLAQDLSEQNVKQGTLL